MQIEQALLTVESHVNRENSGCGWIKPATPAA
ncbi:uncharacterized protein METZ01_LOCUS405165 [marine metagenome]|uniref:Uncharacterized protein n=1 Tax=marine metagenome TaxID=408172 RepID=A0A382W2F5_9ZZZZ